MIVYSNVYSDADQRKHQSSASLAFVRGIHRGPVNSPHKWPVTRKCFHLMTSSWTCSVLWWVRLTNGWVSPLISKTTCSPLANPGNACRCDCAMKLWKCLPASRVMSPNRMRSFLSWQNVSCQKYYKMENVALEQSNLVVIIVVLCVASIPKRHLWCKECIIAICTKNYDAMCILLCLIVAR